MIENIRLMLGDASDNYSDAQITIAYAQAESEVKAYCRRSIDEELETTVQKITIIKLNRMNSEGLASQSFSGVSESYVDGYPADIMMVLNRKRKVKLL